MPVINDIVLYLPTHPTKVYSKRDVKDIDSIVVHQTDTDDKGTFHPYDTARYHVNQNGWAGIGYHYYIIDDGTIFKTNEPYTISAHAREWNNRSLGITITGKHRLDINKENEEIIPSKQYKALIWTLAKLQMKYPKAKTILSHGELQSNRSDPNLHMEELKSDVKKKDNSVYTKGRLNFIIGGFNSLFRKKLEEIKEEFDYNNFVN